MLIIVFSIGEYRWRKGAIDRLEFNEEKRTEVGGKKIILLNYISDDIYNKLPEFTWEEVNERVQRGVSNFDLVTEFENFFLKFFFFS